MAVHRKEVSMAKQKFEMVFWKGLSPAEGGYTGCNARTEKANGIICEYDVAVTMRDGVKIYVDIFRLAFGHLV